MPRQAAYNINELPYATYVPGEGAAQDRRRRLGVQVRRYILGLSTLVGSLAWIALVITFYLDTN